MKHKTRNQKHDEYVSKYGNIPIDYRERLDWLYDNLKITESQSFEILNTRNMMIDSLYFFDTKIILFEVPEGTPRPRARLITRSNISSAAKENPNFIHIYSITGKEDNIFMKRLMSQEDFDAIDRMICTPCIVDIYAYLKTPSYFNKTDIILSETGLIRPVAKPDWDNIGKKYSDMFNANMWLDDTLVVDGSVHKYYSVLPRIEIQLRYLNMVYNKNQYRNIVEQKGYNEEYNLKYFNNNLYGGK